MAQEIIDGDHVEAAPEVDVAAEEDRATRTGWAPEDNFKGDPNKWVPASEWNERTDTILPILKATNKKLEDSAAQSAKKIAALEQAAAESRTTTEKMLKVQATVAEQAYDRAVKDLQDKQKKAAKEEDWDTYDATQAAQNDLKKPPIVEAPPETVAPQTANTGRDAYDSFLENNPWYDNDETPEMTGFAQHLATKAQSEGIIDPAAQFKVVEEGVKKAFPGYFNNSRRNIQAVDDSGGGSTHKKENEFSKLPTEAKEQFAIVKKQLPDYTEKEFLEAYNS